MERKEKKNISKERLKFLAKLKQKKFRRNENLVIIEGLRLLEQLLANGIEFEELYVEENSKLKLQVNCPIFSLKKYELEKITATETPQEIVALIKTDLKPIVNKKRLLYLDGIREPGNLGTIIRTASAFSLDGIILSPDCCEIFNPKVIRASLGAVFFMSLEIQNEDWLKKQSAMKIATSLDKAIPLESLSIPKEDWILILGSEADGIKNEILASADKKIKISQASQMESLNVAVAAGILMHHFTKQ
jgi:RNA methyltransferase, TrmH family